MNKFHFRLDDLLNFVFPASKQHPMTAGRLFSFGLYGPLDSNGNLRSGFNGNRTVAEYELEEMCIQMEKEDILQIYLHKPDDMGLLSTLEQEAITSQADAHLKKARGKAMLPQFSKEDLIDLFSVRFLTLFFKCRVIAPPCEFRYYLAKTTDF